MALCEVTIKAHSETSTPAQGRMFMQLPEAGTMHCLLDMGFICGAPALHKALCHPLPFWLWH
jgi:hypothetical protein